MNASTSQIYIWKIGTRSTLALSALSLHFAWKNHAVETMPIDVATLFAAVLL